MNVIELELNLAKACIETETKRTYERLLREYLRKSTPAQQKRVLARRIEALKIFLEHADFGYLRTNYAALRGQTSARVTLLLSDNPAETEIDLGDGRIRPKLIYGER